MVPQVPQVGPLSSGMHGGARHLRHLLSMTSHIQLYRPRLGKVGVMPDLRPPELGQGMPGIPSQVSEVQRAAQGQLFAILPNTGGLGTG